jgi:uncharacterized SAM-binding protein YcdF (DUF218 family)
MPQSDLEAGSGQRSPVRNRRSSKFPRGAFIGILALAAALIFFLLSRAGSFLVVDDPQRSDVIVVLEGSGDTPGYFRALHLMREGYAGKLLLDANVNAEIFGKTEAEMAREYLDRIGQQATQICPTAGTSLFAEAADVQRCLQRMGASSAILVTSDFGTRRTLSIFQERLPQYRWSVAAASTPYHFAEAYWKHRGWAKTVLEEWDDFLWWKLVDQWRGDVVLH